MTGVDDLVMEECHIVMLQDDMTQARIMVYAESIEEPKLRRMDRNLKRSGTIGQEQTRFKKRDQTQ